MRATLRLREFIELSRLGFEKAHIPLTKCFALSDFGWGSLCSALPGPQATGWRWVYMIKKIQPVVVKKFNLWL